MNITLVLLAMALVAQSHYCLHEVGCERYSCADFSKDAVLVLRNNNIESYPAFGYLNGQYHLWVVAIINGTTYHIEPQTASLVHPKSIYDSIVTREGYYFLRRGVARGLV